MSNGEFDRNALSLLVKNISSFPHPRSAFAGVIVDPQEYVVTARKLYPEALCAKNVHAALIVQTEIGRIEMYGRNAIIHGSPVQLREFAAGSLFERVLNVWLPYVIELQNMLRLTGELQQGEKLIIKQVRFNQNSERPDVIFTTKPTIYGEFSTWPNIYPASIEEQLAIIQKMLLITQYALCKDCAVDISHNVFKEKLEIYMVELSRHVGIGVQPKIGLDSSDIDALAQLIREINIPISYNGIEQARFVWRKNLE